MFFTVRYRSFWTRLRNHGRNHEPTTARDNGRHTARDNGRHTARDNGRNEGARHSATDRHQTTSALDRVTNLGSRHHDRHHNRRHHHHIKDGPPDCRPGSKEKFPHARDCAKYYDCAANHKEDWWGKHLRECGYPLLFNRATKECDHYKNVQCTRHQREPKDPCKLGYFIIKFKINLR